MNFWSLHNRALLLGLIPALVTTLVLSATYTIVGVTRLADALESRGAAMAQHLATASEFGVLSDNQPLLRTLAGATLQEPDVELVTIYDRQGDLLVDAVSSERSRLQPSFMESLELNTTQTNGSLLLRAPIMRTQFAAESTTGLLPKLEFRNTNEIIGWVNIALSKDSMLEAQRVGLIRDGSIALSMILLSLILAHKISKGLMEPIRQLSKMVGELEKGEAKPPVDSQTDDEPETIGKGLDTMAASLESVEAMLEERVNQATLPLCEALAEVNVKNEQLKQSLYQAQLISEAKSQFLVNMIDALRTPLHAMLGYAESLLANTGRVGQHGFMADLVRVLETGQNTLTLIDDILDLAKIEAGEMLVEPEPFDLSVIVDEVTDTVRPILKKNQNTLQISTDATINRIHVDVMKLRQMLTNLLCHASQLTHDGVVSLTITKYDESGRFKMAVNNTGIGMTDEQISQLFVPFVPASAAVAGQPISEQYATMGLGLTLSKQFCGIMGGYLHVESQLNQGTTFMVDLPMNFEASQSERVLPLMHDEVVHQAISSDLIAAQPSFIESRTKISTVLLVEKDQSMCEIIQEMLTHAGFNVDVAEEAKLTLDSVKQVEPDVILLDGMILDSDGWSVLRQCKDDTELCHIPVIMLGTRLDRDMSYALGANEFIIKPLEEPQLIATVQKCVRRSTAALLHCLPNSA